MVSWQFLMLGSLGAVGAALAVGTLAAMIRYWRTGEFPGRADGSEPTEVTTAQFIGLWLRVLVGALLAVWGFVSLSNEGLI